MGSSDGRHFRWADGGPLFRYGVTVAAVAGAVLARWLLDPLVGDNVPYATFFASVALAAWVGGWRTGLLAAILGGGLALYLVVPPRYFVALPTGPHLVGLAMYLIVALAIAGFGEAMRSARRRAAKHGERLRTTLASIGDAVITTDTAGRVTDLNAAAESLTGWATAEAEGRPLDAVFHIVNETTRRAVENPAFRALQEGVIVGLANHTVLIAKDGTERPIEDSAAPIRDRAGAVVGCVLVFRDITERRLAERTVEAERERVQLVADAVPALISYIDADGRYRLNNYAYETWFGHPRQEVYGRHMRDVLGEAAWAAIRPHVEAALAGRVENYEAEVAYRDGGTRWISATYTPDRDEAGAVRGFVAHVSNITDRKRAEIELRRRETFTRGVLGSITDGFCAVDSDWRFTFANDELVARFGRRPDEIVGGRLWELFPAAVGNEAYAHLHRAMVDRVSVEYEVYYDPWRRWFLDKAYPTDDGGLAVYSRDVTARKDAEADLARERERLGLALQAGGLGVYEWRVGADEVWWSPEAYPVFGADPATFRPTVAAFTALVHPDDRDALWRKTQECVERREVFEHEYRIVRPDGEVRWVYNRSHVAFGRDGEGARITGVAADVTERKRVEDRLRESEGRFRLLADAMPQIVYVSGPDGRVEFVNRQWQEYTGQTDAQTADLSPLVHPDDLPGMLRQWDAARAAGAPFAAEFRLRRAADGEDRWFLTRSVPARDGGGRVVRWYGTSTDIHDLKRAEEELQASEERLRLAVEAGEMGTWDADLRTGRTVWSASHFALLGLPPHPGGEATYRMWLDRVHPDDRAAVDAAVEAARRDRAAFALEHRIVRADDGRVRWMAPSGQFHYAADGEAVRFVGVEFDVTDRKEAEAVRRASEDQQAFLVALADALRPLSDPAAVRAAAARVLGRRLAVGHAYYADIQADGETIVVAADYADGVPSVAGQYRFSDFAPAFKADYQAGRTVVLSDAADDPRVPEPLRSSWAALGLRAQVGVPLVKGGRLVAVLGVDQATPRAWTAVEVRLVEDTAERTWAAVERARVEAEREDLVRRLREADRRKDEFLATLAHELRNPLAPLRNGLRIMKLAGADAGAVEKARGMMERQVGQMTHLIEDLMDLSRISRGKIVLQRARLRLADAIQDAVDISRPLIEERGHDLVVDVPPEPIDVDGDRTRLAQVFGNLLNNAAKYTDPGGRIRVAVERQGGDVVVAVEDNGVGIPAPMLPTVFEMFTQVDRSLEKSQGGLGIGLNIVRRLVEKHDGSVTAESGGHGAGSRFVVRLPVLPAVPTDREEGADGAVGHAPRRRILVVDDNRDGAASLAALLTVMGNETRIAHDGLEAVAVAEAFRPDVILMDIGMPRLNGFDACRRIRQQAWGKTAVLVAQTGWGQDDDKRKSREAGFDFHVVKPVDPAVLERVLAGPLVTTAGEPISPLPQPRGDQLSVSEVPE